MANSISKTSHASDRWFRQYLESKGCKCIFSTGSFETWSKGLKTRNIAKNLVLDTMQYKMILKSLSLSIEDFEKSLKKQFQKK